MNTSGRTVFNSIITELNWYFVLVLLASVALDYIDFCSKRSTIFKKTKLRNWLTADTLRLKWLLRAHTEDL